MDKIKVENLATENIQKLKDLFPAIFTDGEMIDLDMLKILLGENLDEKQEKYQFTWNGKNKTIKNAQTTSLGTLIPEIQKSRDWDRTGNYYIEGDNLEVLKLLQKTYFNKVKLIYIDPPYNTGNDFVYKDNFKESIQNYIEQTNQTASSNPDTNGRFHTDWINMMYSRLLVSRNLLQEEGVIFISINDTEQANLRKICDEIFGEFNFVAMFPWQSRASIQNDTDISISHEYVLSYAKNRRQSDRRLKENNSSTWYNTKSFVCLPIPLDKDNYSNPDNDPRGAWKADPFDAPNIRQNLSYCITNPQTGEKYLPPNGRHWRTEESSYFRLYEDNRILFGKSGNSRPQLKVFYEEKKMFGSIDNTWWDNVKCGTATNGTKELIDIFDGFSPFDTPKPKKLIKQILKLVSQPMNNDIILDFFSGSATTAHSVIDLNADDGGNRKFIMVQLPEIIDTKSEAYKAGYKNICEIGEERIRRVGDQIVRDLKEKQKSKGMLEDNLVDPDKLDIGFKVFRLDSSNFTPFEGTREGIQASLDFETINKARSDKEVLYEIMLKYGVFDKSIDEIIIEGKTGYSVGSGYLYVCLDKDISNKMIDEIAKLKPRTVIFDETGFKDDNSKDNAIYALIKAGVEEIKSI